MKFESFVFSLSLGLIFTSCVSYTGMKSKPIENTIQSSSIDTNPSKKKESKISLDTSSSKSISSSNDFKKESIAANLQANNQQELTELFLIESSFLQQDCPSVLEHYRIYQALTSQQKKSTFTILSNLASSICNSKLDPNNIQKHTEAIQSLKRIIITGTGPIDAIWIHSLLGDLYIAENNKNDAIKEKIIARDLLLNQQILLNTINQQIFQMNPNASENTATTTIEAPKNIDQIISNAQQFMNKDDPDQAIHLLNSIPPENRTSSVKRLYKEAVNGLVMNQRYKVTQIFLKSITQDEFNRKDSLRQCKKILQDIIQMYPDYTDISSIKNNLKEVQKELAE